MAKDGTLANLFVQMREQKAIDNLLKDVKIEEVEVQAGAAKPEEPDEGEKIMNQLYLDFANKSVEQEDASAQLQKETLGKQLKQYEKEAADASAEPSIAITSAKCINSRSNFKRFDGTQTTKRMKRRCVARSNNQSM